MKRIGELWSHVISTSRPERWDQKVAGKNPSAALTMSAVWKLVGTGGCVVLAVIGAWAVAAEAAGDGAVSSSSSSLCASRSSSSCFCSPSGSMSHAFLFLGGGGRNAERCWWGPAVWSSRGVWVGGGCVAGSTLHRAWIANEEVEEGEVEGGLGIISLVGFVGI